MFRLYYIKYKALFYWSSRRCTICLNYTILDIKDEWIYRDGWISTSLNYTILDIKNALITATNFCANGLNYTILDIKMYACILK